MLSDEIRSGIRSVAANVRRLREQQGWSQEALAEASGVDLKSVQVLERGTGNPTARVLIAVATALGVPTGRLFRAATMEPRPRGRPPKKDAKHR